MRKKILRFTLIAAITTVSIINVKGFSNSDSYVYVSKLERNVNKHKAIIETSGRHFPAFVSAWAVAEVAAAVTAGGGFGAVTYYVTKKLITTDKLTTTPRLMNECSELSKLD